MRRLAFCVLFSIIALSLIAADCDGNGTSTPPSSGIEGTVTIGPACPVERIDTPCPDKPYQATIAIMDESGMTVATARSGEDGTFRVALESGTYTLHPRSSSQGAYPTAHDQQTVVRDGAYTTVDIQFDTGIR